MLPEESLPIIVVSAGSMADATALISKFIDFDVTEEVAASSGSEGAPRAWRVWRLLNKYYRVDVRVWPLTDTCATVPVPVPVHCVEAHVLYLAENECTVEALDRRMERWREVTAQASVKIVVVNVEHVPPELADAAAERHLEFVALREDPAPDAEEGPFSELCGPAQARAALHAHTWRGLVRLDRPHAPTLLANIGELGSNSLDDENGYHLGDGGDEESMLRHAEHFAALLEALPGARADGDDRGEERLQRAEELVDAFCRALATDTEW